MREEKEKSLNRIKVICMINLGRLCFGTAPEGPEAFEEIMKIVHYLLDMEWKSEAAESGECDPYYN